MWQMNDFDCILYREMVIYPRFLFTISNKMPLSAGCESMTRVKDPQWRTTN